MVRPRHPLVENIMSEYKTFTLGTFSQSFGKHGFSRTVEMDLNDLPAVSIKFLLNYGLKQKLADSYAGAKTAPEVEAALDKILAKLHEGTLAERTRLGGDAATREARKIAGERVDAAARAKGLKLEKSQRDELVERLLNHPIKGEPIWAEARRRVATAQALGEDLDLDDLDL